MARQIISGIDLGVKTAVAPSYAAYAARVNHAAAVLNRFVAGGAAVLPVAPPTPCPPALAPNKLTPDEPSFTTDVQLPKQDKQQAATTIQSPDDFMSRLVKYVPAEVIALYVTLKAILDSVPNAEIWLLWVIFAVGIVGTPLYLWRVLKVWKVTQLFIATIAFGIWVFAMGGPFLTVEWYEPYYGAMLLPLYTFAVPIIDA